MPTATEKTTLTASERNFGRTIDNLREADIDISGKGWGSEEARLLWAKNEMIFRNYADFWRPLIVQGKQCMNYILGRIFDDSTRAYYENIQKKLCIEPRIMKRRITAIVGQMIQARRSGKIQTEAGDDVDFANMVLKYFEKEIKEQFLLDQMAFAGCATGCPQVTMFDVAETSFGAPLGGLTAEFLDWDSFVLKPHFRSAHGEDVNEIVQLTRQSMGTLIDENSDREDEIRRHYNMMGKVVNYHDDLSSTNGLTVEDARYLTYDIITGLSHSNIDGRLLVMQRLYPVKAKVSVAISKSPRSVDVLDYQILPKSWDRERRGQWLAEHPEYRIEETETKILWRTRWTREGLLLKHEPHWFQEFTNHGNPILPAAIFVPEIIDGIPTGPGPDMRPLILMKAISETEYLHDIRTGSGDVLAYLKGAVTNAEDLPTEISAGDGIIQVDPTAAGVNKIQDAIAFMRRNAQEKYGEYSEKLKADLEETDLVTQQLLGQPIRDQSGKSQAINIAQGIVAYSYIAANYNKAYEWMKNLECMLIPYCLTEEQIVQLHDEELGRDVEIAMNSREYDIQGEPVKNPANDLSSVKWRWRLIDGDDSPTARQQNLNEMLIFWNTAAPSLIDADPTLGFLASVLVSLNNKIAKDIGRLIEKKAQVKAQEMGQQQMMESMAKLEESKAKADSERLKAARTGFSFSITPEDLVMHPEIFQMLVNRNYINAGNGYQFQLPPAAPQQALPPPAEPVPEAVAA